MNLSQILNPPGPAIATLASGRSPSPSLPSLAHATPAAPLSRKHSSSVSVARLEDQESATRSSTSNITAVTNTNNTITVPPQKIKPNEINNGYSTHTFRANPPPLQAAKDLSTPYSYGAAFNSNSNITNSIPATSASASAPVTASGTAAPGAGSGMPGQMIMRYNLSQDIAPSSSASTAKKKPRSQIESPFAFHDSFHATPTDQSESKPTSAALKKKHPRKGSPASSTLPETESQPLEIRFVMTDKDGQDRNKAQKPPSSMSAPHAPSPPLDTQTEDTTVQESSHGTPHFEKNADGKFRCSWPRCGKEFTVASRLTTHYRIHSGKPPYLCGYKDCQKAFHTSSSLSHHRVVHTDQGLRPYVCRHNRCGATYTQLARLITHQRTTHSGMILFIPQEASSSSSSAASPSQSQVQSQPPSINTTPSGTPRDDPLSTYHPPTSTPNATETHDLILGTAGSSSSTSGEHIKKTNVGGRRLSGSPPSEELPLDVQSDMVITRTQPRTPSDFDKAQSQYTSRLLVDSFDSGVLSEHAPRTNFRSGYLDSAEGRILATNDRRTMDQEEEESDEMRQRKEAALTMTSFRKMATLQHHSHPPSLQSVPTSYHPDHYQQQQQQQPPSQPQIQPLEGSKSGHHHSNNQDYYLPLIPHRDYSSSSYHQHVPRSPPRGNSYATSPPGPSAKSPTTIHPYSTSSGEYWREGHGRGGSRSEMNEYGDSRLRNQSHLPPLSHDQHFSHAEAHLSEGSYRHNVQPQAHAHSQVHIPSPDHSLRHQEPYYRSPIAERVHARST